MSKVKLIYEKQAFDYESDLSYKVINDVTIPKTMYFNNIEVVKQKTLCKFTNRELLVLRSNDSKKVLRCKVYAVLSMWSGKIAVLYLK